MNTKNTLEKEETATDETKLVQGTEITLAPLTARILAAFVDYMLVLSVSLAFRGGITALDWGFLITFLFGGLYYSYGNSDISGGQTLGKKAFGLRVVHFSNSQNPTVKPSESATLKPSESLMLKPTESLMLKRATLKLSEGFRRYMACFGIALLVAELPVVIFRHLGFIASPILLEANMLAAMVISMSVIFSIFFDRHCRGLHDRFSSSLVIRSSAVPQLAEVEPFLSSARSISPLAQLYPKISKLTTPILLASVLALLFWSLGVFHPEAVQKLNSHRYAIESSLPIRIASIIAVSDSKIEFQALTTHIEAGKEDEFSRQLTDYLNEEDLSTIASNYSVELVLYSLSDTSAEPYRTIVLAKKN